MHIILGSTHITIDRQQQFIYTYDDVDQLDDDEESSRTRSGIDHDKSVHRVCVIITCERKLLILHHCLMLDILSSHSLSRVFLISLVVFIAKKILSTMTTLWRWEEFRALSVLICLFRQLLCLEYSTHIMIARYFSLSADCSHDLSISFRFSSFIATFRAYFLYLIFFVLCAFKHISISLSLYLFLHT